MLTSGISYLASVFSLPDTCLTVFEASHVVGGGVINNSISFVELISPFTSIVPIPSSKLRGGVLETITFYCTCPPHYFWRNKHKSE
jgi:hypothetical protein